MLATQEGTMNVDFVILPAPVFVQKLCGVEVSGSIDLPKQSDTEAQPSSAAMLHSGAEEMVKMCLNT